MGGRFFWSSLSDVIGRKAIYAIFFLLGAVLYALVPPTGRAGSVALFVLGYVDHPQHVRRRVRDDPGVPARPVRHRCRSARSTAGCSPPGRRRACSGRCSSTTSASIRSRTASPRPTPTPSTMYIMAGLLVVGFVCNLLVRAGRRAACRGRSADRCHPRVLEDRPMTYAQSSSSAAIRIKLLARLARSSAFRWRGASGRCSRSRSTCSSSRETTTPPPCGRGRRCVRVANYSTLNSFTMPCIRCGFAVLRVGNEADERVIARRQIDVEVRRVARRQSGDSAERVAGRRTAHRCVDERVEVLAASCPGRCGGRRLRAAADRCSSP